VDLALEVAEQEVVAVAAEEVVGRERHLAAAAGQVDDEVRHGVAGRVAAQAADDLQAALDRRAEVGRAGDRVALEQVVGLHAAGEQAVEQLLERLDAVVDPFQQHCLRAERQAGVGQPGAGLGGLGRELGRVGEVQAQPRPVAAHHPGEGAGDPLRQDDGYLRADAEELDVADAAQPAEQPVELLVAQRERVAAGDEHVADLGVGLDVAQRPLPLAEAEVVVAADLADHAGAGAVAAVGRAEGRGEEQRPVGVAVDEARDRRVAVLGQRVLVLAGRAQVLGARRHVGPAERLGGVVGAHERGVVGRDPDRQRALVAGDRVALVGREAERALQVGQRPQPVAGLPAPVVPFGRGRIGEQAPAERARLGALRERLPAAPRPAVRLAGARGRARRGLPGVAPTRLGRGSVNTRGDVVPPGSRSSIQVLVRHRGRPVAAGDRPPVGALINGSAQPASGFTESHLKYLELADLLKREDVRQ
jgi:hypothetical protein